jgi:hypothetical protein
MNNDNLKRVLNKISGADRASVQQKTPPIRLTAPTQPGYDPTDDTEYQIIPAEMPNEKERIEKFCACLYDLLHNATATTEGWDAQLKSITTSCIPLLFRPGYDVVHNGVDTVATARHVCPYFQAFEDYTECNIHCENLGYIRSSKEFVKCVSKCVELGRKPPYNVPNNPGFHPLSAYPRVLWLLQRHYL